MVFERMRENLVRRGLVQSNGTDRYRLTDDGHAACDALLLAFRNRARAQRRSRD